MSPAAGRVWARGKLQRRSAESRACIAEASPGPRPAPPTAERSTSDTLLHLRLLRDERGHGAILGREIKPGDALDVSSGHRLHLLIGLEQLLVVAREDLVCPKEVGPPFDRFHRPVMGGQQLVLDLAQLCG